MMKVKITISLVVLVMMIVMINGGDSSTGF
jgi:hypothetical protein